MELEWSIIKHFPLPWLFIDAVTYDLGCQPGQQRYRELLLKFGTWKLSCASEVLLPELVDGASEVEAKNFTKINPVTIKRFVSLFEDLSADELYVLWHWSTVDRIADFTAPILD